MRNLGVDHPGSAQFSPFSSYIFPVSTAMPRKTFGNFFQFYNRILKKHKYPVQIVTGGALWFTGDILCQSLVQTADLIKSEKEVINWNAGNGYDSTASDVLIKRNRRIELDWQRLGRMTCYGLVVSAPVYAFWYSYLDRWSHRFFAQKALKPFSTDVVILPAPLRHFMQKFPLVGEPLRLPITRLLERMPAAATRRVWEIIGFKLAADCFLFDPAYLALFFTATNAMEGRNPTEIATKLRTDLLPTYLVDIAVWLPIQTINFRWVPVVYQALFVQSCNIGWNAYLSFVQHRSESIGDHH